MAGPWEKFAKSSGGTVLTDPYKQPAEDRAQNADARADAALGMDAQRLELARTAAARAAEDSARAADKAKMDKQTLNARGGVETTEAERTAAFLATRVAGGLRDLKTIGNIGAPSLKDAAVGGTLLGNYTTDENRQRTINAQRDMLDAALTLGTGAAYTQEQIDAYRASYFPQPGDQPNTIADKTRRLQTLMSAARVKAGAAAGQIDTALQDSGLSAPSNPLNTDQQKLYDAYLASNPDATPDQIRTFSKNAGLGDLANADKIVAERKAGIGVAPASTATTAPYNDSVLSQGLSGVNEGVASTLGAPVDLANSALGIGAKGINALANTNLSVSDDPFLGSEWWRNKLSDAGSIGEDTGSHPFIRRVGQSVGAAAVPIPGLASSGRQVAAALAGGLGGGIGAATAQQVAPGSALAEMGGELAGGGLAGGASLLNGRRLAQREIEGAIPTVPQLQQQAGNLYRRAEQNGVTATGGQTRELRNRIASILSDEGTISPTGRVSEVHPKVKEAYSTVQDYAGNSPISRVGENDGWHKYVYNSSKGEIPFEVWPMNKGRKGIEIAIDENNSSGANRLGVKELREAASHLKAEYPDAEYVYGVRTTGAGPGREQSIDLSSIPASKGGHPMNPSQMQTVRKILGDGRLSAEPNERRVANLLLNEFDDWTAPLAPELADARGVASRYLNAQTLEQARELAESRVGQFSQSGLENGIRTQYRQLDRQAIRGQQPGFSDPLVAQIEDVSRGTTTSNVARALGKLAPRGVVSAGISTGVPFSIGTALGGPTVGAALSAATLGVGEVGRRVATHLADRGATVAELLARNGGDLPQAAYLPPDLQRILAAQAAAQTAQYLPNENPNGY